MKIPDKFHLLRALWKCWLARFWVLGVHDEEGNGLRAEIREVEKETFRLLKSRTARRNPSARRLKEELRKQIQAVNESLKKLEGGMSERTAIDVETNWPGLSVKQATSLLWRISIRICRG